MEKWLIPRISMGTAVLFGVTPCLLGVATAQYLRWTGTVWLSNAGSFWPILCAVTSLAILVSIALASSKDRTARVCGWLILAWSWLYVPLWLTARPVPQSSAVVTSDGRVFVGGDAARQPSDRVWLLTGRATDRIVRNVRGLATASAAELQYRYSESYVSTRSNGEDLSVPVVSAANALMSEEARKSRASRIALFDKADVHQQFLSRLCRAIVPNQAKCPMKLSLSPQIEATLPGAVWSKVYTETEAIAERHLPTLVQLLTQDNSRLLDRDRVFHLFMTLANAPAQLSAVAIKSGALDAHQFGELMERIIALPGCGSEAVTILETVNRLTEEQRRELRLKVMREASLALVASRSAALRISDAEVAQLALRVDASSSLAPEVASVLLEKFGERLPLQTQDEAVKAIVAASAAHALAALKHVNFSSAWRQALVAKIVADATYEDFEASHLSREGLENLFAPSEMRSLIAVAVKRGQTSTKWLQFSARMLPIRDMTPTERRITFNGLMFDNTKSALEFASEYRQYLDADDVVEITRDYARTIAPDFCLHLSHRNKNRKTDYFSEAQLQIFRDCAQAK